VPKSPFTQALVALGAWCVTVHAAAQSAHDGPPRASSTTAFDAREQARRVKVVLVGPLERDRDLGVLLRELLEADGIELELAGAERFDPDALFAGAESDAILVFIRLRDARDARLHFRAPSGERFLLREVELPSGVDAVGRELLGQIVKSSIAVLMHSPEGLSRAEASAALTQDADPQKFSAREAARPAPVGKPAPPRDTPASSEESASSEAGLAATRWRFGAGAAYSAEWTSSDLPVAHGPGAALGLRWASAPHWGLKLAAHRFFPQRVRTELVSASVQRTDAQLLFELGVPLAPRHHVGFGLGPSLEISFLEPTSGAAGVALSDPKTDLAPAVRGEVRYELEFGPIALGVMTFVNVSLVKTHYDVLDDGALVSIATLRGVRPGVGLTLGLM
jgi:hypothetical protein